MLFLKLLSEYKCFIQTRTFILSNYVLKSEIYTHTVGNVFEINHIIIFQNGELAEHYVAHSCFIKTFQKEKNLVGELRTSRRGVEDLPLR